MQLPERLRAIFALDPTAWALEYLDHRYSWGELGDLADAVARAVAAAGGGPDDVVGWAAQNSPSAIASLSGLVISSHCAAILNPHMAPKALVGDIAKQRFTVIVGDPRFWAIPGVASAAKAAGSAGLVVTWDGAEASVAPYPGLEHVGPGPHRDAMPAVAIERLSSGTTGPPKRSPQTLSALMNALALGERKEAGAVDEPLRLKSSPALVFRSLAHAGSFSVLLALYSARPIVLQEKFSIEATIAAVERLRPKVLQLVPTMIQMIWDAETPPEALSSLIAVRSGTAPLDPALQAKFEAKYGFPILVDYGATEFGGVAAWTVADHRRYAAEKRGSVGRAVAGSQIRTVEAETGGPITDGRTGLLEVRVDRKGQDWIPTNDLASIDADGFLYIHGRADDAIVRGGFKVLPDEIANVLRQHPDVQDAAVIGVPDARLGQAPVAVIELRAGRTPPEAAALKAFAREHLTPYQVPVAFKFVDKLPRTVSLKVIRSELLAIATS
jgi:acyl-CoA synthetase (AMP-forming)/AMP-acid ligase II